MKKIMWVSFTSLFMLAACGENGFETLTADSSGQIYDSEFLVAAVQGECDLSVATDLREADNGITYGWMPGNPGFSCSVTEAALEGGMAVCDSTVVGDEAGENGRRYGWMPNGNGGGVSCIYAYRNCGPYDHGDRSVTKTCSQGGSHDKYVTTRICQDGAMKSIDFRVEQDIQCDKNP